VPSDLAQDGVRLVQPLPPVAREHEATGLEELVALSLADEPGAVSELWWRLGGRATARLRLRVSAHRADQVTSPLLGRVLDELPGYDPVKTTLDAWLDAVVDRFAADLT
jgi:hypothetical protein